ncbi:penicillin-binding transpeptidase domain-containing protein [Kitasatospora camelliae]|uniref:Penicillin-binding transpeptidase domain-containing protein n=1 Tax=Kitasatospora camelliae TaxID=3156397 RepID=A0AAU8K1D8_9ACTN
MGDLTVHKGAKIGIATVTAALFVGGGVSAYALLAGDEDAGPGKPKTRTVVAEPPTAEQAAEGAKSFLEAWSKGDLEAAGKLTDKPDTANAALVAFREKLKPSAIGLTPGGPAPAPTSSTAPTTKPSSAAASAASSASPTSAAPAPAGVLLAFKAKVEFAETGTPWNYDGVLKMVKMSDGKAAVLWDPTVLHPKLAAGRTIAVKPVFSPPSQIQDRKGRPLSAFASLAPLLPTVKATPASASPDDAGTGVVITDDAGKAAQEKLFTIKEPKPAAALKLTLDADVQKAAEEAVQEQSKGGTRAASLVAIEPSTGNILAVANAPATGQNRAFLGATAPGSTMKVLSAAALLEAGVTPTSTMPCPPTTKVTGLELKNDFDGDFPNYTLTDDFTRSCNTAFIEKGKEVLKPDSLPKLAKEVFGLGLEWKTGVSNFDTLIPVQNSMAGAASEYIGQGAVQTNPLGMASVAATVQNGTFHQPVLVADSKDRVTAARQLAPGVLEDLRGLMRATAMNGTAKPVMASLGGNSGAKTGTAEIGGGKPANSWFVAYRGNIAAAAEVEGAGHGIDAAGPAVAKVLKVGNG